MINSPVFNAKFRVETAGEDTVFLLSESEYFLLQGPAYAALAPLIDGQKTRDELVRLVQGKVPLANAYYALLYMEDRGFLVEADASLPPHEAAFWNSLGVNTQTASQRLRDTTVSVTALGGLDTAALVDRLQRVSITTANQGSFEVVLTDDYLREELRTINEHALAAKRPWLLAKPVGTTIWIGPFFSPETPGCWECLAQRLHSKRPIEGFLASTSPEHHPILPPRAMLPSTLNAAQDLIVTEAAKCMVLEENHPLIGSLISLDMLTWRTETHTLVPRPQCPACGDPHDMLEHPQPILLQSQVKTPDAYGGERVTTLEATLQAYGHHISPVTGIVQQLDSITSAASDHVVHHYVSGDNLAYSTKQDLASLKHHLRSKSGGKGISKLQAQVGALCEALERYSGVFQGDEYRIRSRYQELGDAAIHPYRHLLYSVGQYNNRSAVPATWTNKSQKVPLPFDENRVIDWTPIWSLTEQRFKYLPTMCCYYFYPTLEDEQFAWGDSNGAAAGNTLEEAILQGFMELVERDGVAIWWYNRIRREPVDLESFHNPYITELQEHYRQNLKREFWVLNLTHDLGIPIFVSVSRLFEGPEERIILGFGAHFDPEIALLRAITEMNQSLASVSQDITSSTDSQIASWWQTATVENQPYLQPDFSVPAKKASDFPFIRNKDIVEDIRLAQKIVEQKGLEMLVLDQTRPEVGLRVAKVIVPGLRHFWTRFAPGRLYDVPVQMKWFSQPLSEAELNPIPMFM